MYVAIYPPEPTPLDLSDATLLCSTTVAPLPQVPETDPDAWQTPDGQGCWTQSGAGTYVVQVRHVDPGAMVDRSGLNRYSVRSTAGQFFALRDFSIYNNSDGSTTAFFLAEVPAFYAGKTFVVELYDPGEFSGPGTGYLQVMGPDGPVWDDGECRVYDRDNPSLPWSLFNTIPTASDCQEPTTSGEYHYRWLKFEMDIPGSYTCNQSAGECWWKINYVYPSGPTSVQDTTTWRAFIVGNPIHLTS